MYELSFSSDLRTLNKELIRIGSLIPIKIEKDM